MTKNIDALALSGTYKSHIHSFFGSDAITHVKPTSAELQKGCSTGDNANDLSVYWIPTLFYADNGNYTEVKPTRFSTYYHIEDAKVSFPRNFAAIAGKAAATSQADVDDGNIDMSWWCEGDAGEEEDGEMFPTKSCSTHLQTILRFPDWVDTANLTNYVYYSVSYGADGNRCPTGMTRIPQLQFSARYDLRGIIPNGWSGTAPLQLACGEVDDGYCFHADFING